MEKEKKEKNEMDDLIKTLTRLLKLFGYGCFGYLIIGILLAIIFTIIEQLK